VIAGGARVSGEEPYAAQVRERIESAGLNDRVVITGFLSDEDVAEAMEASDLVLAPHTWATGSYSVTLPLTHGRPVLASNLDCFQDIAGRMDCIELFANGDNEEYIRKLLGLLEDESKRAKLSENARAYAARFSWPKIAAMTRRVYDQTIAIYAKGHRPQWTGKPHSHFESG